MVGCSLMNFYVAAVHLPVEILIPLFSSPIRERCMGIFTICIAVDGILIGLQLFQQCIHVIGFDRHTTHLDKISTILSGVSIDKIFPV